MHTATDHELEKGIHEQLVKVGASPDRIRAIVDDGKVTMVGTLDFESQRRTVLKAVNGVDGIREVIDKMLVAMPRK